jgi:hypothetical protein
VKRAVIYLHTYHHLTPDDVARCGEPKVFPFEVQERTCRAYCERMRYAVVGLYRATTPPPEGITPRLMVRIAPEPVTAYLGYDSHHPYYLVCNLLAEGAADVRVEFREAGPSGSAWADAAPDAAALLPPLEYASLWEVEPPTELERYLHDLVRRVGDADDEEERAALAAQVNAAARQLKAERQAPAPPTAAEVGTQPEIPPETPALCYACGARLARPASAFCSAECAQVAAERLVRASSQRWCALCARRVGASDCPHGDQWRL